MGQEKGNYIIGLPLDYVVVDTETTGLSPEKCGLIEVSALRVETGRVVESFSSLLRPPAHMEFRDGIWQDTYVDPFIQGLTGISNEMLAEAPFPDEVLPGFAEFLGESPILGHNVCFDIGFLKAAFEKELQRPFVCDYLDTLRLSRKLRPEHRHHRLSDLAEAFGISYSGAHRAEADCHITHECYLQLRNLALSRFTEEEFIRLYPRKNFQVLAKDFPQKKDACQSHPLYGKRVAYSGRLRAITLKKAMEAVAELGGINSDCLGKRTDFLVIGGTRGERELSSQGNTHVLTEQSFLKLILS